MKILLEVLAKFNGDRGKAKADSGHIKNAWGGSKDAVPAFRFS